MLFGLFNKKCSDSLNFRGTNTTVASFTGIHKILSQQVSSIEREENYSVSKIQFPVNVRTDEQLLLAAIKL